MNDIPLSGRVLRLTLSFPVTTPGDYSNITTDELTINGGDSPANPGLRVRFKIEKTDKKAPNTSQIIVTNLSPNSRARVQKKGVKALLEGGYQGTGLERIGLFDVRTADHVRNDADWDSTLKLGDGERAYRFARVTESFAGGTPASAVVMRLANLSGLTLGNVLQQAATLRQTFDHGYLATGRWADVFDHLVRSLRLTWSIQGGALQLLAPGQSVQAAIPLVSPQTGLIGSPEMGTPEKKGAPALIKFTRLLFACSPGSQVQLQSERYNGLVTAKKVSLDGDTHGQEWYTTVWGTIVS